MATELPPDHVSRPDHAEAAEPAVPRVIASVEARMASSRLPGKVLMDINGRPTLARVVDRLRQVPAIDGVVVATTTAPSDDAVARWAEAEDVAIFRGSEEDVLSRVVGAQRAMCSDIVVEICGDCPLIDPEVVDMAIRSYLANDVDVVTTGRVPSFPNGIDVEIFSLDLLSAVADSVDDPAVREHVSLHFYERPDAYRVCHLIAPQRWCRPDLRLVLDYPQDHALIDKVYRRLEPVHGGTFGLDPIVGLLACEPDLVEINAGCRERSPR